MKLIQCIPYGHHSDWLKTLICCWFKPSNGSCRRSSCEHCCIPKTNELIWLLGEDGDRGGWLRQIVISRSLHPTKRVQPPSLLSYCTLVDRRTFRVTGEQENSHADKRLMGRDKSLRNIFFMFRVCTEHGQDRERRPGSQAGKRSISVRKVE